MKSIIEGEIFKIEHPFVLEDYTEWDMEGSHTYKTWCPGIRYVQYGPEGEADAIADGIGEQEITIVSIHKPGRYPERVFYTRKWIDPSGKAFGSSKLRIATTQKVSNILKGYKYGYYVLTDDEFAANYPKNKRNSKWALKEQTI